MRIYDLRTNHLLNPLGYEMKGVRFSWKVTDTEAKKQEAAQIIVAADPCFEHIIYDTGLTAGPDAIGTDVKIDLAPRKRYYWKVKVLSDNGENAESEVNFFETAKRDEAWQAHWIGCPKGDRHPVFRKNLSETALGLKQGKEIVSARLYICGLGLYEASLNGKKIGDELLAPYCNNYNEWIQYQTYDITENLKEGSDFSVMLGDGWYLGRFGFYSGLVKEEKEKEYKLIAEIHVFYADGTEDVVGTDDSWTVEESNITFSNIYDGEQVDDTLPAGKMQKAKLTDCPLPLVERYSLPVTRHDRFEAKQIESTRDETLIDFGQNMSGVFTLRVHEPKGTKVHLQFGEVLQGGHFYRENLRSALAEYIYISDGKEHVLTSHFTFYGFRYAKVSGMTNFRPEDFYVNAIWSDITDTGLMTTENALVNQLISNIRWGQRSNFVDVPTDCPQRDERMGWTGDAQVFSSTAMFLSDSYAFYRKFMHDMETEQQDHQGMVPDVIPSFGVGSCSSIWGDSCCIIPWNMYEMYGDPSILKEQYGSMKAWIGFIRKIDGDDHNWRKQFTYGDWVAMDSRIRKADTVIGGTDGAYISDIYYYNSVNILAKTAEILGKEEETKEYRSLAESIRLYLQDDYFSKTGRCCSDTQTAQALALEYDIAVNRKMTADMLKSALIRSDGKLQTGFAGTPVLNKALCNNGLASMAYDLLLNEECPGWLYEVKMGATTIWERWNSIEPDGSISSTGMNSLNHYAYGAILDWMTKYTCGLKPLVPGYRKAQIAPIVDSRLGGASLSYDSASGKYEVSWKIDPQNHRKITVSFTVPFGCSALVKLPGYVQESFEAEAGSYEMTYQSSYPLTRIYSSQDKVGELLVRKDVAAVIETFIPDFKGIDFAFRNLALRDVVLNPSGDLYRDRQVNAAGFRTKEQLEQLDQALAALE